MSNAHRVVVKRNTSTEDTCNKDTCNNIQRINAESTESWVHKINGLYKQALERNRMHVHVTCNVCFVSVCLHYQTGSLFATCTTGMCESSTVNSKQ